MDREELEKLFDACDAGRKGYLDRSEFARLCEELSLPDDELHALFQALDTNKDGKIQKLEFAAKFYVVDGISDESVEQHVDEVQRYPQNAGRKKSSDVAMRDNFREPLTGNEASGSVWDLTENNVHRADTIGIDFSGRKDSIGSLGDSGSFQPKTSTPVPPNTAKKSRGFPRVKNPSYSRKLSSWNKFADEVGHIIYDLSSYDSISSLYNLLDEQSQSDVISAFEEMMSNLLKDIEKLKTSNAELESSLQRSNENRDAQLLLLEEEMETQIAIKETKARNEERLRLEAEANLMKSQYEERISQLQDAVTKLRKVDERLSKTVPLENEMEKLRERLYETMKEKLSLQAKLEEAETQIVLLQTQIASLNAELHEKSVLNARETDAAFLSFAEQQTMTEQVLTLTANNRKLRDSHDDLREVLESQLSANKRLSSQLKRVSPRSTVDGGFRSPLSSLTPSRLDIPLVTSGRSSQNSNYESDVLAQCDPQLSSIISEGGATDDETEADFSFKSSVDGVTCHGHNGFERDSGLGTYKDEQESDLDSTRNYRRRFSASRLREVSASSFGGRQRNVQQHKENFGNLTDVTDEDGDAANYTDGKRRRYNDRTGKKSTKRKIVLRPQTLMSGPLFKVILCGDMNVGKSSFIFRACKDKFNPHTRSTLGVDFQQMSIILDACQTATLQLWDTAGQERFRSISASYFRRADGVVLVYDVSNPDSFLNVREWMDTIWASAPEGTPVMICGNKVDLRNEADGNQSVTQTEGAQLAASYGVLFVECSAASGQNVNAAIQLLARHLASRATSKQEDRGSIKDLRETATNSEESKCCLKS